MNDDAIHLQNVSLSEVRSLLFMHVDNVIFNEHEFRSLQSLVSDYKHILSDYECPVGDVKSSYLKELLTTEYNETIGFNERSTMNKSEWVYDVHDGRDYIQAAM